LEKGYPDPDLFGITPAYGMYVRHVMGLEMNGVEVTYEKEDTRPAYQLVDVKEAELINVKGMHAPNVQTVVRKD